MRHVLRKSSLAAFLTLLLALMMASSTAANGAFFHSYSASVGSDGDLVVSFDERGLGNSEITYVLTADAEATWACINGGGKNPSAQNKRDFFGEVTGGATFDPKNGRVQNSVSAGPLGPDDFSCPNGQRLVLAVVSYSNIVLTDTTNGISVYPDDIGPVVLIPLKNL